MLYTNAKEKQQVKDLRADYQCGMQLRTKSYECGSSCNEGGAKGLASLGFNYQNNWNKIQDD
jgi:hypothetical protein